MIAVKKFWQEAGVKQKLQDHLKAAMKAGDKLRTMTLRGVLAEVTRLEKEVRREANEEEIIQVIRREKSKREEMLGFARSGGRPDLVEENETEARILESYLPAALGAEEIRSEIAAEIAAGNRQIGSIMKSLKAKFGTRLDARIASEIVKEALKSG
jgi:uncharacterized protein